MWHLHTQQCTFLLALCSWWMDTYIFWLRNEQMAEKRQRTCRYLLIVAQTNHHADIRDQFFLQPLYFCWLVKINYCEPSAGVFFHDISRRCSDPNKVSRVCTRISRTVILRHLKYLVDVRSSNLRHSAVFMTENSIWSWKWQLIMHGSIFMSKYFITVTQNFVLLSTWPLILMPLMSRKNSAEWSPVNLMIPFQSTLYSFIGTNLTWMKIQSESSKEFVHRCGNMCGWSSER